MGYMPVYYFNQNSSFGTQAELKSMIKTFEDKGLGTIADVVVNHRNNLGINSSWVDYPSETYNGVTYQMLPTDIVANDDGGATKTWANTKGISLSSNNDEGEDWSGCRDLDHKSANVQTIIKAYENFLINDLGYTGFRYDMVKGFNASHVADYNDAAGVSYSVGECWDSNSTIEAWINNTNKKSAAFDFQFRYNVRDAVNNNDWSKLNSTNNLVHDVNYSQYAVTFVENHDTQYRSATETLDPIKRDTLATNAYLLAMPGTPCVFLPHWKAYKQDIKAMIDARKAAGIKNTSTYTNMRSSLQYYANRVEGDHNMIVVVGFDVNTYVPTGYTNILSGYHYKYYMDNKAELAFADKASGTYSAAFDVTVTAASENTNAKLVYTLDGTNPTTSSEQLASGSKINISSSETLKVGLLKDGNVSSIITRDYIVKPFKAHTATVYLKDPSWSALYFYAWDSKGNHLNGDWPGSTVTNSKVIAGNTYYYKTFDVNSAGYTFNIIFNQGSGKLQTVDLGPISKDTYYEISSSVNGKYSANDITSSVVTGIDNITTDNNSVSTNNAWYNLEGMRLTAKPTQKGIYIHQGKKLVVK
jgi:alpha-amylase